MKIGMIYDLKESYGIEDSNIYYEDFSTLSEIDGIKKSLESNGYETELIGSHNDFVKQIKDGSFKSDLIFNMSEGFNSRNREALVPSTCELFKIPYTFSDSHTMNLTLDKHQTLLFAKDLGINIPNGFIYIPEYDSENDIEKKVKKYGLIYPLVCKPNYEGTSMGITIAKNIDELKQAITYLTAMYNEPIRCDEYIDGREIAVPIIGTGKNAECLSIVEYQTLEGDPIKFYTHQYKRHGAHKTIFADYGKKTNELIFETALTIHKNIPCYDLSRIDMRLYNGKPYLLEVTPLPDLTRNTTFERSAKRKGISFDEITKLIVESSISRMQEK